MTSSEALYLPDPVRILRLLWRLRFVAGVKTGQQRPQLHSTGGKQA